MYAGQPVMSGDPSLSDAENAIAEQDAMLAQQAAADDAIRTAPVTPAPPVAVPASTVMSMESEPMTPAVAPTGQAVQAAPIAARIHTQPALAAPGPTQQQPQPSPATPQPRPTNPYVEIQRASAADASAAQSAANAYETQGDIAAESRKLAIEEQGQAKSETSSAEADVFAQMGAAQDEHANKLRTIEAAQRESEAVQQREIDDDQKFLKANAEPKDRRTGAQRAAGLIGMLLGGIGSAMQSAALGQVVKNPVIDIVNESINRDLQRQQAALDNTRTAMAAKQTSLAQSRARYQDDREALQFARVMELDKWKSSLEEVAKRGESKEAQAKAQEAIAVIDQERSTLLGGFYSDRFERRRAEAQRAGLARYQEQKAAAAAAAARADNGPDYSKFTVPELERAAAIGQLPAGGIEYLNKVKAGDAGVEKAYADIDKLRAEAANGGGHKSAQQVKTETLMAGVQKDVDNLVPYLSADKDIPYFGVRSGTQWVPDAVMPEENIRVSNSVNAIANILLRDESGAAIGEDEANKKRAAWGIDSGDPQIRKEGLRKMLYEYAARKNAGKLPATIDAQPKGGG